MKIRWEVNDGTAGKSYYYEMYIYPEDYSDYDFEDAEDVAHLKDELYETLHDEFLQTVTPRFSEDVDSIIEQIKNEIK